MPACLRGPPHAIKGNIASVIIIAEFHINAGRQTVFLYGFAKSERDNIGPDELDFWRRVARSFLEMDAVQRHAMTALREIMEVDDG